MTFTILIIGISQLNLDIDKSIQLHAFLKNIVLRVYMGLEAEAISNSTTWF